MPPHHPAGALLSLLDSELFPSLEAFLAQFGTLTDAAQVEALKEAIRPYLLRRQKSDVLTGDDCLAPLEETVPTQPLTIRTPWRRPLTAPDGPSTVVEVVRTIRDRRARSHLMTA